MVSLNQAIKIAEKLSADKVRVEPSRCVRVRHRLGICTSCLQVCDVDALHIERNTISLDAERCNNCGACSFACPTQALLAVHPSKELIVHTLDTLCAEHMPSHIAFYCSKLASSHDNDAPELLGVPCLAFLDESILVHAASLGIKNIVLASPKCDSCDRGLAEMCTKTCIEECLNIFELWHFSCDIKRVYANNNELKSSSSGIGRRKLARELIAEAKTSALQIASIALESINPTDKPSSLVKTLTTASGKLRTSLPERTELLLNDLFSAESQPDPDTLWSTRLFARVHIDTKACSHCGMCARFCPTAALVHYGDMPLNATKLKNTTHKDSYHEFRMNDCVNCGLCTSVCPQHAISLDNTLKTKELFEVVPKRLS